MSGSGSSTSNSNNAPGAFFDQRRSRPTTGHIDITFSYRTHSKLSLLLVQVADNSLTGCQPLSLSASQPLSLSASRPLRPSASIYIWKQSQATTVVRGWAPPRYRACKTQSSRGGMRALRTRMVMVLVIQILMVISIIKN